MERFIPDNKNFVKNHPSPQPQDSVEKVLFRLKDLQEIQDESRNELCPVFLDEESNTKSRRDSGYNNQQVTKQINILQDLEQLQKKERSRAAEPTINTKRVPYNQRKDDNLLLSNMKLKEDNIKLFSECIRLRKMCELYKQNLEALQKQPKVQPKSQKQTVLQRQVAELKLHLDDLQETNKLLEDKIKKLEDKNKKLSSEISSTSLIASRYDKMSSEVQFLQKQNDNLAKKVIYLEKQLELSSSRCESKSVSIHNTTQQSRKGDVQKDRMLTNMKIVHESEVRKLKGMIQQLQRELGRQVGVAGGTKRR